MINGNTSDFVDKLYYGDELWFIYDDIKYLIQGHFEEGTYNLYLFIPYTAGTGYTWVGKGTKDSYPVEEFLNAPLFGGKSFWDVEADIEWVDC